MLPYPLYKAVKLSNKASEYMQKGEYGNATIALSQAVMSIKTPHSGSPDELSSSSSCDDNNHSPSTSPLEFVSPKHPRSVTQSRLWPFDGDLAAANDAPSSSCSRWYLYEQSVRVNNIGQHESELTSSSEESTTAIISYAMFYNLGLCHHMDALRVNKTASQPTGSKSFKRAIVFYNQAQRLLNNYGDEILLLDNNENLIHSLAVTNNLSHIYHCLDQETTVNICVRRLWTAIVYHRLMDDKSAQIMANHDDLCYQGLLTNVWNHLLVDGNSAPAAAA